MQRFEEPYASPEPQFGHPWHIALEDCATKRKMSHKIVKTSFNWEANAILII